MRLFAYRETPILCFMKAANNDNYVYDVVRVFLHCYCGIGDDSLFLRFTLPLQWVKIASFGR